MASKTRPYETKATPWPTGLMLAACVVAGVSIVAAAGCGGASTDRELGAGGSTNSGGGVFDNPSGAAGARMPIETVNGGEVGLGEECSADVYQADGRQLDIYMMVDDSGSMVPWWFQTLDAINMFFADPRSAGVGVGVQFFGSSCDPNDYATPRVPIAPLPGNVQNLQMAFPPLPIEGTATMPAMQGAIMHARSWAASQPNTKAVVLLVTDGLPDNCGSNIDSVTQAIADGVAGQPSIQTFVVGIGLDLEALNGFAQAGGTGEAVLVSPGAADSLLDALADIRQAALPCDYSLPAGAETDIASNLINLRYTAPGGAQTVIGFVPDAANCDATQGGWHYDNPAAPTRVVACQTSCQALKEQGGEVQVVLGCPRVNVVPI